MSYNPHFPDSPVTVIFRSEPKVGIFKAVEIVPGSLDISPLALVATGVGTEKRKFALAEITQDSPNYWEAKSSPGNVQIIIRPTTETDVLNCITVQAAFPLPLEVIESLLEPIQHMPVLYAMSEDDGYVATMMLSTDVGMYMRYSGNWHKLDPDAVDGLNVTEVLGGALDMFDQFDRAGQLVNISAMPKAGNEPPRAAPVSNRNGSGPAGSVTGSVAELLDVPTITGPEDAAAAISLANDDPDLRWFVTRRLKAMGIEADLPWEEE